MEDVIIIDHDNDTMNERIALSIERIRTFPEPLSDQALRSFFTRIRDFDRVDSMLFPGCTKQYIMLQCLHGTELFSERKH